MYRIQDESGRRLQYLFEMLKQASGEMSPTLRRDCYKHVGGLTLFNLGLFPEHLSYGRHTVSPDYYAETGRRSYTIVAEMDSSLRSVTTYRRLCGHLEHCGIGLYW